MPEQHNALVDEVTPIIAKNLSDSEKKAIIEKLQRQESEIKDGIADKESIIHITLFTSEQEIIRRWASRLKQLHYLGVYEKPINTISAHIKWQIGKMDFELDKKDNLIRNISRSLDKEYKDSSEGIGQNVPENTSAFCNSENSHMFLAVANFKSYHEIMADLGGILLEHLKNPIINREFTQCLEWEEISEFCSALEMMQTKVKDSWDDVKRLDENLKQLGNFSTLEHIREELNIRQSADTFRDAMYVMLGADKSFRKMAHAFGLVPRQGQRIRNRLDHWPKKDAKKVMQMVMYSYGCRCGCGIDLTTNKRIVDRTSDDFFWKTRYRDRKLTLPAKYKGKYDISPIAVAEKMWGRKMTLVEIKPKKK